MRKYFLQVLFSMLIVLLSIITFTIFNSYKVLSEITENSYQPAQKISNCEESKSFPGISKEISTIQKGKTDYFPKDIFGIDFLETWYGTNLKEMKEESFLKISDKNKESYRFLWLRSFHHPIFVRVERNGDKYNLVAKEFDGKADIKPGKLLRTDEKAVSREEWCEFLGLIEKSDFWNEKPDGFDLNGLDGAQWVLEGVKDNRYHAVNKWSPEKGDFREACIYLLKLSGINVDELES